MAVRRVAMKNRLGCTGVRSLAGRVSFYVRHLIDTYLIATYPPRHFLIPEKLIQRGDSYDALVRTGSAMPLSNFHRNFRSL